MVRGEPSLHEPDELIRLLCGDRQSDSALQNSDPSNTRCPDLSANTIQQNLARSVSSTDRDNSKPYSLDFAGSGSRSQRIILSTVGTFGDLHPFLALAQALQKQGFNPILAVSGDHLAKARAAGIEAIAIFPSFNEICSRMGLGERAAAGLLMGSQRKLFEQTVLDDLSSSTVKLDALVGDADLIVASSFVLAAPIVAEKRGAPLVSVVLQPMALLSALDPPRTPDFWMMANSPTTSVEKAWNRGVYAMYREVLQILYGRKVDRVRMHHGLRPTGGRRIFEPGGSTVLTLGCYSRHFAPLPPDIRENTKLVGFSIFDSESGTANNLDPALEAFLVAGPPPLVFTLGTFATRSAGEFYVQAAKVSQRIGMRALLLTGQRSSPQSDPSIFECAYAPHSLVFPRAAAIIHHGGIGTTGQALRAGKPQLVVPHMGDQNDHAHRIVHLGVGLTMKPARFIADHAAPALSSLLENTKMRVEGVRIAALIATEDAAAAAAALIVQELERHANVKAAVKSLSLSEAAQPGSMPRSAHESDRSPPRIIR